MAVRAFVRYCTQGGTPRRTAVQRSRESCRRAARREEARYSCGASAVEDSMPVVSRTVPSKKAEAVRATGKVLLAI